MEVVWFLGFLVLSHFGAMLVFTLTTYHRYFWPALPLLIGYSAAVGWALFALEMHQFFFWQLFLASIWLFFVGKKNAKQAEAMLNLAGDDVEEVRMIATSTAKTTAYYTISAIVYVVGFSVAYLWLYNA